MAPSTAAVVLRMSRLEGRDSYLVRVLVDIDGRTELIGPLAAACTDIEALVVDLMARICSTDPPGDGDSAPEQDRMDV